MVIRELPMEKYTILPVCNMKICLNLCFIVIHLVLEATLLKYNVHYSNTNIFCWSDCN